MIKSVQSGVSAFSPSSFQKKEIQETVEAASAPVSPTKTVPHVDRTKVDPQLVKAAEGMEAMFLDYMMKVMRQTVPKNEMDLESPATEIYRGMMDSEYAQKAAHQGGVGLADQIIAYLDAQGYNHSHGHGAQTKEKP
jgi:flagellar protein FlgJ